MLALLIFQFQTIAENVTTFKKAIEKDVVAQFDESEIYNSFHEITNLLSFLRENENSTYDELRAINYDLLKNVSTSTAIIIDAKDGAPPVLGAFWWGCILGMIGVLIVYITTDNNHVYMKPAWRGCGYNLIILDLALGIRIFWIVLTEGL